MALMSRPWRLGGLGSSPRMRGAQITGVSAGTATRIIPADAGSTGVVNPISLGTKDHPRGCGEHKAEHDFDKGAKGSSPRMRGARVNQRVNDEKHRIIPADAGSTAFQVAACLAYPDHPRGCGEHQVLN